MVLISVFLNNRKDLNIIFFLKFPMEHLGGGGEQESELVLGLKSKPQTEC